MAIQALGSYVYIPPATPTPPLLPGHLQSANPLLEARKDVYQAHWCQTAQSAFRAGSRAKRASPRSWWDRVRKEGKGEPGGSAAGLSPRVRRTPGSPEVLGCLKGGSEREGW